MLTKKTYYEQLQVILYKNKLNELSIIDLINKFSSNTIKNIIDDLEIELSHSSNDKLITNLLVDKIDKIDNLSTEYNKLYIFSDGNCKDNGKKYAKGGYSIYFGEIEPYNQFNKTIININQPTNNEMELLAIKLIFKTIYKNIELFKDKEIIICSDSQYSINCIENWSNRWIKNGWINNKKEPVKNKELIQKILELKSKCKDINIKFKHIFGHTKEPLNKKSLEWILWYGNNKVDSNINELLNKI